MANASQIATVRVQLPDEALTLGITDDIISTQYDLVGQTKAILFCLRALAAKVAPIEDIQESGSQRTQQFHQRLMLMITDWQSRANAEDELAGNMPDKVPGKSHTAVRV